MVVKQRWRRGIIAAEDLGDFEVSLFYFVFLELCLSFQVSVTLHIPEH